MLLRQFAHGRRPACAMSPFEDGGGRCPEKRSPPKDGGHHRENDMKPANAVAAGLALALDFAPMSRAETFSISTFLEPNHLITRYQNVEFAEAVRAATDGAIDFEVFTGGALLPAAGTLQGVADGVAQGGTYAAVYAPSQL